MAVACVKIARRDGRDIFKRTPAFLGPLCTRVIDIIKDGSGSSDLSLVKDDHLR